MIRISILVLALTFATRANAAPSLGSFNVSPGDVAVGGISSGAFLAVQLHVAYSSTFTKGAAIFAGGPFYCAQDSISTATFSCMEGLTAPSASASEAATDGYVTSGDVDPTSNLSGAKVWMWSGTLDTTVSQSTMNVLQSYYLHYGASVTYESSTASGHGWISPDGTVSCGASLSPYVNDCGVDAEQEFLGTFFGTLAPKNSGSPSGTMLSFDQNEFFDDQSASNHSVDSTGYLYVPASCASSASCHLMVALHGCAQSHTNVGDAFIDDSGLNAWADTNGVVVLYPQAIPSVALSNPNGCWDWWGYTGANYATHGGAQMRAIKRMVDRISAGGSSSSSSSSSSASSSASSSGSSGSTSSSTSSSGSSSGSGSTSGSSSSSAGGIASAGASSGTSGGGASSGGCGSAGGDFAPLALAILALLRATSPDRRRRR